MLVRWALNSGTLGSLVKQGRIDTSRICIDIGIICTTPWKPKSDLTRRVRLISGLGWSQPCKAVAELG